MCGLNDIEQLGDKQETVEQPQKLSKHCDSTHAAFEKKILNLEDQIHQEKIHRADQLHEVHENYQKIIEKLNNRLA